VGDYQLLLGYEAVGCCVALSTAVVRVGRAQGPVQPRPVWAHPVFNRDPREHSSIVRAAHPTASPCNVGSAEGSRWVGEQGGEGRRVFTLREAGGCERCACGCVALSTAVVGVASVGCCR
jgi:hypothetical protein